MLFSELSKLTKGECTQEEYEAVNAVYMTLDDMSKEDAAKLWKKLYSKKHKEEDKAKRENQRTYHVTNWCGHNLYTGTDLEKAKDIAKEYAFKSASDVDICAYDENGEEIFFWETSLSFCEA